MIVPTAMAGITVETTVILHLKIQIPDKAQDSMDILVNCTDFHFHYTSVLTAISMQCLPSF